MVRPLSTANLVDEQRAVPANRQWPSLVEKICLGALLLLILGYVVAYSSKSIAAYATGNTLFDLAAFERGFWNATKGTLFFYSLEGEMSRFGRHFSPIFILMLPIYALHRDPSTLLILQTLALALAAVPLYLFARGRLASPPAALILSALYLASPIVHDLNIINEFHEITFVVPLLFFAFDALEKRRWGILAISVIGALMVKEEVALTMAAFGTYVLLFVGHRRLGLAILLGSLVWFALVIEIVMPALRGPHGPVPIAGYEYLGQGVFGMANGVLTKTGDLVRVITEQPKQEYVYWLLAPVGFLALLAPEVLLGALPALLEVLASTSPYTYHIFERYAAPIIPFIFIAAIVGIDHTRHILQKVRVPPAILAAVVIVLSLGMSAATVYAQLSLNKYPTELPYATEPDKHAATAIRLTQAIPEHASVVAEDHRWLARLAHRKYLYFLSALSPNAEYLLIDRKVAPITSVSQKEREAALLRTINSEHYLGLRCEDGISLYVRQDAFERDGNILPPYRWENDRRDSFNNLIQLVGYSLDKPVAQRGENLMLTLYWKTMQESIGNDYTVFVQVLDKQWQGVAQHDSRPQNAACTTVDWKMGEIVQDPHLLTIRPDIAPGEYELHIGLYALADMKRLGVIGTAGAVTDDKVVLKLTIY